MLSLFFMFYYFVFSERRIVEKLKKKNKNLNNNLLENIYIYIIQNLYTSYLYLNFKFIFINNNLI